VQVERDLAINENLLRTPTQQRQPSRRARSQKKERESSSIWTSSRRAAKSWSYLNKSRGLLREGGSATAPDTSITGRLLAAELEKIADAIEKIEAYRIDYNAKRPYSAIGKSIADRIVQSAPALQAPKSET
jgi:hypothetical protein